MSHCNSARQFEFELMMKSKRNATSHPNAHVSINKAMTYPTTKWSSELGIQLALNAVSHRPVLLLCRIFLDAFGVEKSLPVFKSHTRNRSSLHVDSNLVPVSQY